MAGAANGRGTLDAALAACHNCRAARSAADAEDDDGAGDDCAGCKPLIVSTTLAEATGFDDAGDFAAQKCGASSPISSRSV